MSCLKLQAPICERSVNAVGLSQPFELPRVCRRTVEPGHEIMALFALRRLIIQMRMRSHPVGLDV